MNEILQKEEVSIKTFGSEEEVTKNFPEVIRQTIIDSTKSLNQITIEAAGIRTQNGWKNFWAKSQNINTIAEHLEQVAMVQKKSLDMILLLMGASGRMKTDYDVIINTINDLNEGYKDNDIVIEHLINVKMTIKELQQREVDFDALKEELDSVKKRGKLNNWLNIICLVAVTGVAVVSLM
ncbi:MULTISPECIES: hypothetical protein [Bacillaceae]|uniref:Uncharacterized protein n=1 Tax=Evansella alkalicola TaxID=745819 RepID=A0ABS6JSR8_9BACI|nr:MULTISPECIES: hypothetical protein [Bacillaceae]MBU9721616.1 hypothetical protein [Bacillus alkalicola]